MEKRFFEFDEPHYLGFMDSNCKDCKKSFATYAAPQNETCAKEPAYRNDGILTMAFVDMQPLESVYPEDTALCKGTLFPNLDKPFFGGKKR